MNIEKLNNPPHIGQSYDVPCVFGTIAITGPHKLPHQWWPILRPSHQDSIYSPRTRTIWKETDVGWDGVDETYYEDDPSTPHHLHIDPRFCPDEYFTEYEQRTRNWHNVITIESDIEWRTMICVREMPIQRLFTGFGKQFLDDYKNKKMKCSRCPHKGTLLNSMPNEKGVVTCPAHGLRFDCNTKKCISEWP
jgi:hypothetical protein